MPTHRSRIANALFRAVQTCLATAAWMLAIWCAPAQAAFYKADASAANAATYPWIDISTTGTAVSLGDDSISATITPPFSINFGSSSYTGVRIMSNGQVQFGGSDTSYLTSALPLDGNLGKPNVDALMMPLWDDLSPSLGGSVRYQTTGVAPNRVFTVSWIAVPYYGSGYSVCTAYFLGFCVASQTAYSTATFQVQIHEQGVFVYRYGAIEGNGGAHGYSGFSNSAGATVGFEISNTDYLQYARNSAVLTSGTTIVWSHDIALRAQWDFESITSNTTPDSSGNGNTLTLGASGVTQGAGASGYGATLNGGSPAAGTSAGATVNTTGSYTVEAWVKFTSMSNCAAQSVVSQDATTAHPFEIVLIPNCGLPQPLFFEVLASDSDAAASTRVYSTFTPVVNTWYHVAGVRDAAAGTIKFYVNCTLQGTASTSVSWASSGPLTVGRSKFSGGQRDFLNGKVDVVKVWTGALTAAEVSTECLVATPANLVAEYKFEQAGWNGSSGEVLDTSGEGRHGTAASLSATRPTTTNTSPAVAGSPGTCRYASFNRTNKDHVALPTTLPNLGATASFTVSAWFRTTDRTQGGQRIFIDDENGWGITSVGYILSLGDRGAGMVNFHTRAAGTTELTTSALVSNNTWYFVAFGVDFVAKKKFIELRDVSGSVLASISNTYTATSIGSDSGIATIGGESNAASGSENISTFGFSGNIDDVRVYDGALTSAQIAAVHGLRSTCAPLIDHLEIQHSSGSGLTCTPSTMTLRACQDAACTALYTGGISGTLTATGAGMTVNWPTGAPFTIPSGSSSVTEDLQLVTAGSVLIGLTGASPAPTNAATCNFGSPSCTYTAADAGLFFDVPNHRAEVSNSVAVTAVKKADNSASCVPAFASVSKAVNFKCAYVNPSSGTQAVRVGSAALNSGNSATSACDATGQSVTLAFDATGKANTSVIYADAGAMTLTGTYTGSGTDAGLSMTGSDTFIAAPTTFTVAGPAAGNIAAGTNFTGSVTAKNYLGNPMPNFGKETSPEGATLGWVRTQPQGSAAVNGAFTGSLGSFNAGAASGSALKWSEVGRGELSAVLTSGSYLGTGMHAAGATNGSTWCADQLNTCTLPAGVTAFVYYGYGGYFNTRSGVIGSIGCNNAVFGDPLYGEGRKFCSYVVTSGSSAASTGTVGPFIPHHFDVTATPACSSTFSYAGQPFAATVTARNASNATTVNYDGSANTSPNFAKVTTLADVPALGLGSWSNASVPVAAYALGVASATPSYAFTSKTTAPQSFAIRATDTGAVSSLNFAEPTMPLRSGRLAVSNAFGSEKTSLAIPVQAQYWSGLAWVLNGADSCTTVPASAVVRAAYRDNKGAASTAWTSSASAITIAAGTGTLTLGAPSPATTGSLDFSLNLGATNTDQSCLAAHPASTGGGLAWLRSQNGACSTAWDRDPSARATFGIYTPETRKTIHVREIF